MRSERKKRAARCPHGRSLKRVCQTCGKRYVQILDVFMAIEKIVRDVEVECEKAKGK